MENSIQVIGAESSVIYYNLNKQYSTLKKVIITKEILLNSFENEKIRDVISKLMQSKKDEYAEVLKENGDVFETNIKSELYQNIQDSLNKLSNNYVDVHLKDYNFMSSISNANFNVTLRCESFSITNYYAEKGTLLTKIRNLIKQYIEFSGNIYRLSRLDNFQIEICESEEIYKHVYLKKESDSLLLSATFGFPKNKPIDYSIGAEFYVSKGTDFKFYKNNQNSAVFRDHNKLVEKEINKQEKILSNEDLVLINEKTKNIDDALIECYLSAKGNFRIVNLSLIENGLGNYSDNGFIINKSHNHYDRVSLLVNKENFDEDSVNPNYWLLKNDGSVKEFMEDMSFAQKVDGIVFTQNFYIQFLDKLGAAKNIDIVYFKKNLQKSLDEKIDWENVDIESSGNGNRESNPFKGIITEHSKGKDEMLERLKNIDLSTPSRSHQRPVEDFHRTDVESAVNSIIGSSESSFNKGNSGGSSMDWGHSKGEKKSAFSMLMDSAMKQETKVQEQRTTGQVGQTQQRQAEPAQQQQRAPTPFDSDKPSGIANHSFAEKYLHSQRQAEPAQQQQNYQQQAVQHQPMQQQQHRHASDDSSRYEDVLATEIIVEPFLEGDAYIVDRNTISQMRGGKTYYLSLDVSEMGNPNLNYILPIGLNNPSLSKCDLLVNNAQEFFLIDENQNGVGYFANIGDMNDVIKERFVEEMILKVGPIGIICMKKDLDFIASSINKIKSVQVKDVRSPEDYEEVRRRILGFEKRFLMR